MPVLSPITPRPSIIKLGRRHLDLSDALEWSGCLVSLTGAALLAININLSPLGWLAFLTANLLMIMFALRIQRYGLLVQQLGFTATSLVGICRADFAAVNSMLASLGAGGGLLVFSAISDGTKS